MAGAGAAEPGSAAHHRLEVRLLPEIGRIEVTDQIEGGFPRARFTLDRATEVREARVEDRRIELAGGDGSWRLPEDAPPNGTLTLRYRFDLPREPDPEGPFLGPEGGFIPAWSDWLPAFDDRPVTFDLTLEVPEPFKAVATGDLVEEAATGAGYRARFRSAHPGEAPSLFVGRFVVEEREVAGVRLRTWFTEATADLAGLYLERTGDYLQAFEDAIGDYPYAGFAVVAAPIPVGLGFAGLTYVSERILPLPFMQTRSLAHEILHSWWGNAVRVAYEAGNWAEGLTTYMADYALMTADDPAAARAMRLQWLRDYNALPASEDTPLTRFVARSHDASQIVGYGKTAFVFHMLRRRVGEPTFEAALRHFYRQHRFERASWADLRASFEAVGGADLGGFFAQWLERPGAAELHLETVEVVEIRGGFEVRVSLAQAAPFYDLRVPVTLETSQGFEPVVVRLDGARTTAVIETDARPLAVAVDPGFDLFRRLADGEAPPILRDVTLDPETRAVLAARDHRAAAAAARLAEALLDRDVEAAPVDAVPVDAPLLLIGVAPEVDDALARLGIDREGPDGGARGSAAVWTIARPDAPPVLVVRAADAAALAALLRPLPHYRRDSWLVFDGATVTDRGVWPAGASALRRDLR